MQMQNRSSLVAHFNRSKELQQARQQSLVAPPAPSTESLANRLRALAEAVTRGSIRVAVVLVTSVGAMTLGVILGLFAGELIGLFHR